MKSFALPLAVLFLFAASGCGSGHSGTARVSGKVLHGGQPVVGAAVAFLPEGGVGRPASAVTDQTGMYELTTFSAKDGAIPGKYTVTVSPPAKPAAPGAAPSMPMATADDYAAAMAKGIDPVAKALGDSAEKSDVPADYRSVATSPLKKEVVSGSNVFDLLVD